MGLDLVVLLSLGLSDASGMAQRFKPMLVQKLVPELAVEALNVAVLHGPPWLDQDEQDSLTVRPCHEGPALSLIHISEPTRPY